MSEDRFTEVEQKYLDAIERINNLEAAIRKHRDMRGDDRCYLDDRELYSILPEGYVPPPHDTTVTIEQCQKFIQSRQDPRTSYISPQRRIEELETEVSELRIALAQRTRELLDLHNSRH